MSDPYRSPGLTQQSVRMASGWKRVYSTNDDVISPILARYRQLEAELQELRAKRGSDSDAEVPIIFEMKKLWGELSKGEQDLIGPGVL
jgi:hypothetical protein